MFGWGKLAGHLRVLGFPGGTSGKESACQCRRHKSCSFDPWIGKIPWSGMAAHYSVLAWSIPWTEEPGRPQCVGSQRVGHDWSDLACTHAEGPCTGVHSVPMCSLLCSLVLEWTTPVPFMASSVWFCFSGESPLTALAIQLSWVLPTFSLPKICCCL